MIPNSHNVHLILINITFCQFKFIISLQISQHISGLSRIGYICTVALLTTSCERLPCQELAAHQLQIVNVRVEAAAKKLCVL